MVVVLPGRQSVVTDRPSVKGANASLRDGHKATLDPGSVRHVRAAIGGGRRDVNAVGGRRRGWPSGPSVRKVTAPLQFRVPADVDASALEQELLAHGRQVRRDTRPTAHTLQVDTDGTSKDRELVRQLITGDLIGQWVPHDVTFCDETNTPH